MPVRGRLNPPLGIPRRLLDVGDDGIPITRRIQSDGRADRGTDELAHVLDFLPKKICARRVVPGRALEACHQHSKPPSTRRSTPVTKEAAELNRKMAGPTISSTVAMRPMGVSRSNIFRCSATSGRRFIGVSV